MSCGKGVFYFDRQNNCSHHMTRKYCALDHWEHQATLRLCLKHLFTIQKGQKNIFISLFSLIIYNYNINDTFSENNKHKPDMPIQRRSFDMANKPYYFWLHIRFTCNAFTHWTWMPVSCIWENRTVSFHQRRVRMSSWKVIKRWCWCEPGWEQWQLRVRHRTRGNRWRCIS